MAVDAEKWIRFLRQYGPIARNANMFDEEIRRWAVKLGVTPIAFEHPLSLEVLAAFSNRQEGHGGAVILTGTAGDGKSYLCGQVWDAIGGSPEVWASNDVYFRLPINLGDRRFTIHVIRDLTALPDTDPGGRYDSKPALLHALSTALFEPGSDIYLLAANDGQLVENWRKLGPHGAASRALALFEARLMNDEDPEPTSRLVFFNLSTISSATILTLALDALITHEGWDLCYAAAQPDGFFGPLCPIRHNLELLRTPLVRSRLIALFRLCDFNELHTPIRRVLLLLANAILGHPRAKDGLMTVRDVRARIEERDVYKASLYSNLFGSNLTATKRESLEIFEYLGRFGIGNETTNRIDNILIFGSEDENLRPYYRELIEDDVFYGSTDRYRAAQRDYIEMPESQNGERNSFLEMLAEQRRGLFFKIPDRLAEELKIWNLTVFTGAGEYLREVAEPLARNERVSRHTLARLVKGLNRIFSGLLVSSDRELLLATSLSHSGARVSQLLEDRIAIAARGRTEKIEINGHRGFPQLQVTLPNGQTRSLPLNLTRYEFLVRVSDGALPGNFSRECYEDILAFKSSLLTAATTDRDEEPDDHNDLVFRLLSLDASGNALDDVVEISNV